MNEKLCRLRNLDRIKTIIHDVYRCQDCKEKDEEELHLHVMWASSADK